MATPIIAAPAAPVRPVPARSPLPLRGIPPRRPPTPPADLHGEVLVLRGAMAADYCLSQLLEG